MSWDSYRHIDMQISECTNKCGIENMRMCGFFANYVEQRKQNKLTHCKQLECHATVFQLIDKNKNNLFYFEC